MENIKAIRVLLVEDDDEDADILCRYTRRLEHYAAAVTRAANADEADSAIERDRPDVIFLDLNLGEPGSGLELLRATCARPGAPPVVVVTGSGDEEKAAESMRGGAADYLVKDRLSPELLERTIRTVREKHLLEREREQMIRKLAELSILDELTSVANRRHLMAKLEEEVLRSERTGHTFVLVMVDLDDFKGVNDRYGHQIGDDVLRRCAAALGQTLRNTDFVARYGGDEFCILLPDTPLHGARRVGDAIRSVIEALPAPVPTASVGAAVWEPRLSRDALLGRADDSLYAAKRAGKNRSVMYGDRLQEDVAAPEDRGGEEVVKILDSFPHGDKGA